LNAVLACSGLAAFRRSFSKYKNQAGCAIGSSLPPGAQIGCKDSTPPGTLLSLVCTSDFVSDAKIKKPSRVRH